MSLINEALKKAAQNVDPDDALQNAYPQKLLFVSGRQSSGRPLILLFGALVLVAGAAAVALQLPAGRQFIAQLTGLGRPAMVGMPHPAPPPPAAAVVAKPVGDLVDAAAVNQQIQRGLDALENGDAATAITLLTPLAKAHPESAAIQNALGLAEKAAGNVKEAERDYKQAILLDHNFADAHNNLALLYDQQGQTEQALADYTTALSLRKNYPEARLNYAIALERAGRLMEAKFQYQQFLANVPPKLADVAGKVKAHLASLS